MDSFDVELCLIDEEMAAISLHTVTGSGLDSGGFNPVPSFRAVPEGRSNALGLDHRPEFDHADSEEPVDPPARRRAFRTWYAPVIQVASPAHLPSSKRVNRSDFGATCSSAFILLLSLPMFTHLFAHVSAVPAAHATCTSLHRHQRHLVLSCREISFLRRQS